MIRLTLWLLLLLAIPLEAPIMTIQEESEASLGYPTGVVLEAPVETPVKAETTPYDQTWTEEDCLSHTMYWESKGKTEGKLGMVLVGLVIVHRAESKKRYFPNSICSVVKQPKTFSYFWDGRSDVPLEKDRFELAKTIAKEVLIGKYNGLIPKSVLYYKRCDKFSKFFEKLKFYKRHVSHCFYLES